jgi:hypothetical protein
VTVTDLAGFLIAPEWSSSGPGQRGAAPGAARALGLRYPYTWAKDWIDLTGPGRTREAGIVKIGTAQIGRGEVIALIADRAKQRTVSG